MFYRLFRMQKSSFHRLCQRVRSAVGESQFKSEYYLETLKNEESGLGSSQAGCLYRNSRNFSGDDVSGEWKMGLALRYLAGATCFDLYLWSHINPNHIKKIVDHVLQHWICCDEVIKIDYYKQVLSHDTNMGRIRREFSYKTNGIIAGCVRAVDGWLVKIRSPKFNKVDNPGKYYSRKQVYGITV